MATTMNKTQICEMLCVMADMVQQANNGTNFVEISTYVRNHVPGILPEYVEVFRDIISPIVHKHHTGKKYVLVTYEYGSRCVVDYGDCRQNCLDEANHYNGDNGFAYIYTTDRTVPELNYNCGGTEYFDTEKDLLFAVEHPVEDDSEENRTDPPIDPELEKISENFVNFL